MEGYVGIAFTSEIPKKNWFWRLQFPPDGESPDWYNLCDYSYSLSRRYKGNVRRMGIIAQYLRVSEVDLELYRNNSLHLEERLQGLSLDPNFLDLDKAWDGIIFLLTGISLGLGERELLHAVVSNKYVDEHQDFGCGPAHYLSVKEVKSIYKSLACIDEVDLERQFDVSRMRASGVYPTGYRTMEYLNYLKEHFFDLVDFFRKASEKEQAIIGVMSTSLMSKGIPKSAAVVSESLLWKSVYVLASYGVIKSFYYLFLLFS